MRCVPASAWDLLDAADFAGMGVLPVSGGYLDQSPVFNQALRFIRSQESRSNG